MTIIQLSPALQQSVHAFKRAELRKQSKSFMVPQLLSTQEQDALVKTFTTPKDERQQDTKVRSMYWW